MPNLVLALPLHRILPLGALALALSLAPPVLADVYTWTDEHGTVHFTDRMEPAKSAQRGARLATRGASWNRIQPRTPDAERHVVDLEPRAGALYLRASLGNVEAPFILDTGAQVNVLPLALARRMGLEIHMDLPTVRLEGIAARPIVAAVVTVPELRVGSVVVRNVKMAVLDSVHTGFLGMPLLERFRFSIDSKAGELVLEEMNTKES